MICRTKEDEVGQFMPGLKKELEKEGHFVDLIFRNEDLHMSTLSSSMEGLKEFTNNEDKKNKYDLIYTHDWSIAFPLLFPYKTLYEKHWCLFHNLQEDGDAKSKILSKITANLLGSHFLVRTEELKRTFPKSTLSQNGLKIKELIK